LGVNANQAPLTISSFCLCVLVWKALAFDVKLEVHILNLGAYISFSLILKKMLVIGMQIKLQHCILKLNLTCFFFVWTLFHAESHVHAHFHAESHVHAHFHAESHFTGRVRLVNANQASLTISSFCLCLEGYGFVDAVLQLVTREDMQFKYFLQTAKHLIHTIYVREGEGEGEGEGE
ncbi:hypothetical protein ACJX0J_041752, partial [Zea mays]